MQDIFEKKVFDLLDSKIKEIIIKGINLSEKILKIKNFQKIWNNNNFFEKFTEKFTNYKVRSKKSSNISNKKISCEYSDINCKKKNVSNQKISFENINNDKSRKLLNENLFFEMEINFEKEISSEKIQQFSTKIQKSSLKILEISKNTLSFLK